MKTLNAQSRSSVADLRPPTSWNIQALAVSVLMALRGLTANKLRAFLTTLGVIIGVGAVIVAIGIGEGSRQAVSESLKKLGTNTLTIMPGQQKTGGISLGFGSMNSLKLEDATSLLKTVPELIRVCPQVSKGVQVKFQSKNDSVTVNGVTVDYVPVNNHNLGSGRFFTELEDRTRQRVAVLGSTTAKDLFGGQSPIDKTIRVAGQNFKVIGVLQTKGGMGPRNPDDGVYIPINTAMKRLFGLTSVQNITCQARSFKLMTQAEQSVRTALKKRHHIQPKADADFIIFNQADLASAQNEQQGTFTTLITCLAVVSLAVGGIGIMNIMLVSVTERTREIGVRKAIGARRRDVLAQFIFEALILSSIGGLFGVIAGLTGAKLVGDMNGWTVAVQATTVLLSFSFSAMVGVFFGFYPALKASKLRPIEALRYE